MAGSRHAASVTRLIQALPALKGRSRRTTSHGPRVAGKRAEGGGVDRFAGRHMARLVTWGFASADRNITEAEHRLFVSIAPSRWPVGHRVTSVTGGRHPRLRLREALRTPRGSAGDHSIVAQSGPVRGPLRRLCEPAVHGASRGRQTAFTKASAIAGVRNTDGFGQRYCATPSTASAAGGVCHWQGLRSMSVPSSSEVTLVAEHELELDLRVGKVQARRVCSNGKRATAAVMRYGC